MKKFFSILLILFALFLTLLLSYCEVINDTGSRDARARLLGGGLVSSLTANDISPKMIYFPDETAYLFFASDRDGSYDIFKAKYDFRNDAYNIPEKLGGDINDTSKDEKFFDVLIDKDGIPHLYYTRYDSGIYNIYHCGINKDTITSEPVTNNSTPIEGIVSSAFYNEQVTNPLLMFFIPNETMEIHPFKTDSSSGSVSYYEIDGNLGKVNTYKSDLPGYFLQPKDIKNSGGQAGFIFPKLVTENNYDLFIFPVKPNDNTQSTNTTTSSGINAPSTISNINPDAISDLVKDLNTEKNDITPYMDKKGIIYCSSDIFGNYDLFRFNTKSIIAINKFQDKLETLSSNSGGIEVTDINGLPNSIQDNTSGINITAIVNNTDTSDPNGLNLNYEWMVFPKGIINITPQGTNGKSAILSVGDLLNTNYKVVEKFLVTAIVKNTSGNSNFKAKAIAVYDKNIIFVNGAFAGSGDGSYYNPVSAITQALALSGSSGKTIAVAGDSTGSMNYSEIINMSPSNYGNLIGGYSPDFVERNRVFYKSTIAHTNPSSTSIINISSSIPNKIIIDGMNINFTNSLPSITISAINATDAQVYLLNNYLFCNNTGTSVAVKVINIINSVAKRIEIYNNIVRGVSSTSSVTGIEIANAASSIVETLIGNNTIEVNAVNKKGIVFVDNALYKIFNNMIVTPANIIGGSAIYSTIIPLNTAIKNNLIAGKFTNAVFLSTTYSYATTLGLNVSTQSGLSASNNVPRISTEIINSIQELFPNYGTGKDEYLIKLGSYADKRGLAKFELAFIPELPLRDFSGFYRPSNTGYSIGALEAR